MPRRRPLLAIWIVTNQPSLVQPEQQQSVSRLLVLMLLWSERMTWRVPVISVEGTAGVVPLPAAAVTSFDSLLLTPVRTIRLATSRPTNLRILPLRR
mgnify:CR=1 FL=1